MADHRELLVCCDERAADRAADLLRRHLDRTELAVREAFTPFAVAG
jgi:DNA-binding GntR family transcriptional regulator